MKNKKATKKQKIWAVLGLVAVAVALVLFITIGIPTIRDIKNSGYNSKYVYDGTSLVGKWHARDNFDDGNYRVFEFLADGRVITTDYVYGIEAVSDTLSTYRVENKNELIITYNKSGSIVDNQETRFSISNDNTTLVLRDQDFLVLERYDLEYNKDSSIYGEWVDVESLNKVYKFKNDYTGTVTDGSTTNYILYSTKGDALYMFIDEFVLGIPDYTLSAKYVSPFEYKIENDILTLSIDVTDEETEKTQTLVYTLERKK